jgi:hypothetical protein
MSVALPPPVPVAEPKRRVRPFTVEEFYRLSELGIFGPNHQRLELIEGKILEPMAIGPAHAAVVTRMQALFLHRLSQSFIVRSQNPVRLSEFSEPLPDLSVLRYRADFYQNAHPGPADVVLLIEVSDSTLEFDLVEKARVYAEAGIVEYWVLDLAGQRLRVFRRPEQGEFTETLVARREQAVEPRAISDFSVGVHELLG